MKGQKNFLAPLITGIVVSIVYLVTSIMGSLKTSIGNINMDSNISGGLSGASDILGDSIPTFLFQIPVGLYLTALGIILVIAITNLENGDDNVLKKFNIGKTLISTMKKYMIITTIGMIIFAFVGQSFMSSI